MQKAFYRKQVTVILNDAVFEPSYPFRHVAALKPLLVENPNPICMYLFVQ